MSSSVAKRMPGRGVILVPFRPLLRPGIRFFFFGGRVVFGDENDALESTNRVDGGLEEIDP